jgi:hypothetical protein
LMASMDVRLTDPFCLDEYTVVIHRSHCWRVLMAIRKSYNRSAPCAISSQFSAIGRYGMNRSSSCTMFSFLPYDGSLPSLQYLGTYSDPVRQPSPVQQYSPARKLRHSFPCGANTRMKNRESFWKRRRCGAIQLHFSCPCGADAFPTRQAKSMEHAMAALCSQS